MIKIKTHDGPGRLGEWNDKITPTLIDYKDINIIENIATPYKIQKEIAEENL